MTDSSLSYQLGLAVAIVHLIEFLKKWPAFRWMSCNTATINRAVALAMALATAIGLQTVVTGNLANGGHIEIAFPPLAAMIDAGVKALVQYGAQQVVYRTTVDPKPAAVVVTVPPVRVEP